MDTQRLKKARYIKRMRPEQTPTEPKRLPLTENELPVERWTGEAQDDAIHRGQRADAKMMKNLERTCWECGNIYNPPLFSSEGRLFCSMECNNAHRFTDKEQTQILQNMPKEWQAMVAAGVFDNREDRELGKCW